MHTDFPHHGSSRISYSRWGTGDKLLLCFHGYGESGDSFAFLAAALGNEFTILAIDLPFHGQTEWKEGPVLLPDDLLAILSQLTAGLPGAAHRWWLLGYSMGGRVALSLAEKIPEKIEKLILVAPDGLKMNPWYWLATQNAPGRGLFRWTMKKPGWFFFILKIASALGLVNRSIYKFTFNYIADPTVREELYNRWTTMRSFRPDIPAVRSSIREQGIAVRLMYGRHDRIIRWETGEKFRKGISAGCKLVILETGHRLLQEKNAEELLALLKG
ncbi:MAG TPA: alpha/beta hydrolase [Puia sp.]|nr:alpha/beta hydrolase [Puia sp.]